MLTRIVVFAVTCLFGSSSLAAAQEKPKDPFAFSTPVGVNIGRHWVDDSKEGALLGLEISAVRGFSVQRWGGGFVGADLLVRGDTTKLVAGVEAGQWPVGIDLGALWSSVGAHGQGGFQVRLHLTGICSSLYAGAGMTKRLASDDAWQPFALFGLLLKVPVVYPNGWPRVPFPDEPSARRRPPPLVHY